MNQTKRLATAGIFITIGVISSHLSIPIGAAKVFPIQHCLNLLTAMLFPLSYTIYIPLAISIIRNILGTGTLLAFPGSIIGAFLAGLLYRKTKKGELAFLGELIGTGIFGAILAYPIVKFILGREAALFFFVIPFSLSSLFGATIGYMIFNLIKYIIDKK
ncbi:energy coupling factor transporter S component ThiW [Anaerobranca californiensis DSM 14826]|uniref:Energy coupling factor transporter S component ThiW n=1 Tax=Anaerobranca californiensis DSM 14826 TaxID=1120989 RepID=A0A1M6QG47_9FIRM|nr:energy coupling factor transporter S component ThiW [Anaerobranca californiensis]SHK19186.1 energy coupling factor transporter S component ThiW [Anaerobranca californiensis DSM 14826]